MRKSPRQALEAAARRVMNEARMRERFNLPAGASPTGRMPSPPELQRLPGAPKPATPDEPCFIGMDFAAAETAVIGAYFGAAHLEPLGRIGIVANDFAAKALLGAIEEAATGPITSITVTVGPVVLAHDHAGRLVANFAIAGALAQVMPELLKAAQAEGYETQEVK